MALRPRVPPILEHDRSEFLVLRLLIGWPFLLLLAIRSPLLEVLIVWRFELVYVLPPIALQRACIDIGVLLYDDLAPLLVRGQRRRLASLFLGQERGDRRPGGI
jgi:hypothetical protein